MKQRLIALAVVLLALGVAVTALALSDDDDGDDTVADDDTGFVGLVLDDAIAAAEDQDRPWRIARQDDEHFALTDDLQPGRVTFEVDDGIVTAAGIEQEFTPPADYGLSDAEERAGLIAAALQRLVTVDNSFGGQDVFDEIRVTTSIAGRPLTTLERDFIVSALSETGDVVFVDDFDAETAALFDSSSTGVAVIRIERLEMLDDRSEVELSLWCGSLCGVFLTYEAAPTDTGWEIVGTVGPVAQS